PHPAPLTPCPAPHAPAPTPAVSNSSTLQPATVRTNTARNSARPAGPGPTGAGPQPCARATGGTTPPRSGWQALNAVRPASFAAAAQAGPPTTGHSHGNNSSHAGSIQTTRVAGVAFALRVIHARQPATTARLAERRGRSPTG